MNDQDRPGELAEIIAAEIAAAGKMTFARYMEICLYHPTLGYYRRPGLTIGKAGDFFTSPQVGAVFGHTLAAQVEEVWELAGRPDECWVVEYGAGTGALAADIAEALADRPLGPALRYLIIETSERLREVQAATIAERRATGRGGSSGLGRAAGLRRAAGLGRVPFTWAPDLGPVGDSPACVVANELVDAFPVHVVRGKSRGGLEEMYVARADGPAFAFQPGPPSTPELAAYLRWLGVKLERGQLAEVNLRALRWVEELDRGLVRGAAIIIDYGYLSPSLYHPEVRRDGTLMTYHRHHADPDPLTEPGERDITAHVNFSALAKRAGDLGWVVAGYTDQLHFLVNLGILEAAGGPDLSAGPSPQARAVKQLIMPGGMGERFKVLALCRGLSEATTSGSLEKPVLKGFSGILPGRAE